MTTPVFIDSDNAMGAPWGDVDDGFAIAALLRSGVRVAALASVAGNATEEWADRDNRAIARLCGFRGALLRGAVRPGDLETEASHALAASPAPLRVAALGPLTNIAGALQADRGLSRRIEQLVIVGANTTSRGISPPWWPHEFNLTKDRGAARIVFDSVVPLTVVPLDVAIGLRVSASDLVGLDGELGAYLREKSQRWIRRCRIARFRSWFPVWDLVAAMYLIEPQLFEMRQVRCTMPVSGWLRFGRGEREITVVERFDRGIVWNRFLDLLALRG